MTKSENIRILKYWYAEEFLLPQTLEPVDKINNEYQQSFTGDVKEIIEKIENLKNLNENNEGEGEYAWEFVVYGLIYKIDNIKTVLLSTLNVDDDFEEKVQKGNAASYALSFNTTLGFKRNGVQLSTAPWAIKHIVQNKNLIDLDYESFQTLENKMKVDFNENAASVEYQFSDFIKDVDRKLTTELGADLTSAGNSFQVIAKRKKRKNIEADKSEIDLLNSFYIDDLNKTIEYIKNDGVNNTLNTYLEVNTVSERKDIRKNKAYVYNMLSPNKLSDGCWPSVGSYPLVYSQQFAINSINERLLKDGGVYSVNGPPGTGKTTMLRDHIASVMTNRAKEIVKLDNPKDLFEYQKADRAWKNNDTQQWYRKLKKAFLGHEIVVASSNNGAVENITMEIPSIKSIDQKWLKEIDYFSDIGSDLIGDSAWGSGAACLGNSTNKNKFISNFWNDSTSKGKNVSDGFSKYLQSTAANDTKKNEEKLSAWNKAKNEFINAVGEVEKYKKEKMQIKHHPDRIAIKIEKNETKYNLEKEKLHGLEKEINLINQKLNELMGAIESINQDISDLTIALADEEKNYRNMAISANDKKNKINEWYIRKPSVLDVIFTLGKSWKRWNATRNILENEEQKFSTLMSKIQETIQGYIASKDKSKNQRDKKIDKQSSFKEELEKLKHTRHNVELQMDKITQQQSIEKNEHAKAIDLLSIEEKHDTNEENREKSSPWTHDKDFQNARTLVFIKALNLHKALIDVNAKEIRMNLLRVMDVLANKVNKDTQHEEAVRHAWATLFLCVPVVSTTFASFGRLFSQLSDNKIGWLLIDEAGQASAKSAVGAILRSQRVVAVGDPLQLEPIIGLPGSVQEILRKSIGAHEMAFSNSTSVQKFADFSEVNGTYLKPDEDEGIWVGSPLRVHRRCNSPMFEISNKTTYKGLMVQGKGSDKCTLNQSTWFDINSTISNGHWIEDEGEKAVELVQYLLDCKVNENDIYLISPFRDVVNGLKRIFQNTLIDQEKRIGTIHTVQGKEAKVVILVLGSDPENDGARLWASSKPNLLNVAVTRAKDRLYIIGNKSKWNDKQYFKDAVSLLC